MKLTPDLRHHLEVQYLASRGLLNNVMDKWVKNSMLRDGRFNSVMNVDRIANTILNYAFRWGFSVEGHSYWDSVHEDIMCLIRDIEDTENGTDTRPATPS